MSRSVRWLFFPFLFLLWVLAAKARIWDPMLAPSPWKVAQTFGMLLQDGTLIHATAISLRRVLVGYGISLAVGIPLGVLLGRSKIVDETVGVLVVGIQALPSICWLPMAILWFGLNDRAILFVVVAGSLVSIAIGVKDGVRNLPTSYVRAAQTMGTSPWRIYTQVLAPAALPSVLTASKLGWGYAWRSLMSGELLFVSLGLGQMMMQGRELADMSQVLVVMLVIVALGLFVDRAIFGALERHVRNRWGLQA